MSAVLQFGTHDCESLKLGDRLMPTRGSIPLECP